MVAMAVSEDCRLSPVSRTDAALELDLEAYRRELTGYCYRMLGSGFEAEDAVQETMVRAWKAIDTFEGRSALRSWLYRIATNVCLDMLRASQRRARPMDLGPASTVETATAEKISDNAFVQPVHDVRISDLDGDPAEVAEYRDTIRLAFVAALSTSRRDSALCSSSVRCCAGRRARWPSCWRPASRR